MAWKKKKGVCQAYCELYYRIGLAAGLDVRIITGFGRTKADFDEIQENHCWIVVNKCSNTSQTCSFPETITYEEGEEEKCNIQITKGLNSHTAIFVEPTWGAGTVENGKFIQSDHDMTWFDVDPCWMIFTHFPKNSQDQMLGLHTIEAKDFKCMPYLLPCFKEYGFDGADLLSYFGCAGNYDFPKIYPKFGQYLEFLDIPITGCLCHDSSYSISLLKKKDCHVAIINEGDFITDDDAITQWRHDNSVWRIDFVAKKEGVLSLSIRDFHDNALYHCVMKYEVT